jgi:hypothetical protein
LGGGLAGGIGGQVSNSYATGTVTVKGSGGGLIASYGSTTGGLSNSFATGDVFGGSNNGGLIGTASASDSSLVISNVYATGDVLASQPTLGLSDPGAGEGGLIGVAAITGPYHITLTNAHATGNVTAALNYGAGFDLSSAFGGLVGQFNDPNGGSLIENSYATGTVDASKAATVQPVGGLVGRATGVNIKGSYSTGAVIGKNEVGGLVGMFFGSGPRGNVIATIDTSYTTSTVTATNPNPSNPTVGALIGQAAVAAIGPDVFFNGGTAGGVGLGNAKFFGNVPGEKNNSQGLNAGQLPDAKFYANGTINQVLADRAAAATAQAIALARPAAAAATVAGTTDAQTSALTPPTSDLSAAGTKAVDARTPSTLDDNLKSIENNVRSEEKQQQERRRRLAATTTTSHHTGHRSGNPGASIRTIDVDGQRFNLQNGTPKLDEPAQPPH